MKNEWLWSMMTLACSMMAQNACAGSLAASLAVSSASVTGLNYTLLDLDVTDGVTPWITFNQNYLVVGTDENYSPQVRITAGDPFSAPAQTVTAEGLRGSNEGSILTRAQLSSQSVQNLPVDVNSQFNGIYYNGAVVFLAYGSGVQEGIPFPPDGGFSWTLSPHTALLIEGSAQVSARVDLTQLTPGALLQGTKDKLYGLQLDSHGSFNAQLLANATFSSVTGDFLPELNESVDVSAEAHQGLNQDGFFKGEGQSLSDSAVQSFSIQVANESIEARDGVLSLYTGSQNALSFTPALVAEVPQVPGIPEPNTWLLMGLGLGLITWRVKGRCA